MYGRASIATRAVDRLDERVPFRDWPPKLKAQWHDFFSARINRELRFMHAVGLATCLACLVLDAQAGILGLGLTLRLGLVVPAYLIALALLRRGDGLVRALATVVPIALFVGVASYLGMAAQSVFTDRYVLASAGIGAGNIDLFAFTLLCCTVPIAIKLRGDRLKDSNFILTLKSREAQDDLLAVNRHLETLSSVDALTAVLNRRGFEQRFAAAFEAARQTGDMLAVLLLDIDHFKRFNDTHGHQAGDRCLTEVGQLLNSEFERHDGFAGRYGGEEFIGAMVGKASREAEAFANRIRTQIAQLAILDHEGRADSITVSVGVRVGSPRTTDREKFVTDADRALYAAKDAGRNRVVVLGDDAKDARGGKASSSEALPDVADGVS